MYNDYLPNAFTEKQETEYAFWTRPNIDWADSCDAEAENYYYTREGIL
jgi:hypothetical protein